MERRTLSPFPMPETGGFSATAACPTEIVRNANNLGFDVHPLQ